jgi:hypothetical protein
MVSERAAECATIIPPIPHDLLRPSLGAAILALSRKKLTGRPEALANIPLTPPVFRNRLYALFLRHLNIYIPIW